MMQTKLKIPVVDIRVRCGVVAELRIVGGRLYVYGTGRLLFACNHGVALEASGEATGGKVDKIGSKEKTELLVMVGGGWWLRAGRMLDLRMRVWLSCNP